MKRKHFLQIIKDAFKVHPVVAILGPRQCGKTTLARMYANETTTLPKENYFDLEDYYDLARLENPQLSLSPLKGLIVIDEIQRKPDLFPTLRVLCDKPKKNQKFLILGSASSKLLRQSSESLAGRIHYIELTPFNFQETKDLKKLWIRGGFPRSFLAEDEGASLLWRKSYIRTFVEQDVPSLGFRIPPQQLWRFWMMLTHYHGGTFNGSEIGKSLNLSYKNIRSYTDLLTDTLMIRQLQPWHENISKRQVKSPKIYFRDSGLFHTLLGAEGESEILRHPKLGSSWEGFALEEIIRFYKANPLDCYFWATHSDAGLDLILFVKGQKLGFEFKYTDFPKITKSMQIAQKELKLDNLTVIYPGNKTIPLTKDIQAIGLEDFIH